MEVVFERCCGLHVHKATVVACLWMRDQWGKIHQEIKTSGTMTADLLVLYDWLRAKEVTHIAMESTGVFWKPIYNLLEDGFTVLLVNAAHIKRVPGRKTEVTDCEWIADLLAHGLLKGSFIPPKPIRELRDLTRYRKSLIDERVREMNRLPKLLQSANIKLSSVASDAMGMSGRKMLEALLGGNTDPEVLADLARGKLRKKLPELQKALHGRISAHHRLLSHRHLASWTSLCPSNNESAGKRKKGGTRKGNLWFRRYAIEMALAASRTKDTYLSALYHRLVRRKGHKKAIVAVAHAILVIIYHVLKHRVPYRELGADSFDRLNATHIKRHYLKRLESLGFKVTLKPLEAAA
jgi:transposase